MTISKMIFNQSQSSECGKMEKFIRRFYQNCHYHSIIYSYNSVQVLVSLMLIIVCLYIAINNLIVYFVAIKNMKQVSLQFVTRMQSISSQCQKNPFTVRKSNTTEDRHGNYNKFLLLVQHIESTYRTLTSDCSHGIPSQKAFVKVIVLFVAATISP